MARHANAKLLNLHMSMLKVDSTYVRQIMSKQTALLYFHRLWIFLRPPLSVTPIQNYGRIEFIESSSIQHKSENATPELFKFPFIHKMTQTSKANESASECSKTGLCITVKFLCML